VLTHGGDAHDDVAGTGAQCVAEEAAALCPPRVFDTFAKIVGQEFGDLVFKALAALV